MRTRAKILVILLALMLFGAKEKEAQSTATSAEGVATEVKGSATLTSAQGKTRKLEKNGIVYGNDVVETGDDSFVRIVLVDESTLEIQSNTRLQINDSRMNAHGTSSIVLFVGWLWAKVTTKPVEDYAFEVEGPTVVAGVRGTRFAIGLAADGSLRVGVEEGRVEVKTDKEKIRVPAGEAAELSLDGQVRRLIKFIQGPQEWIKWLTDGRESLVTDIAKLLGFMADNAASSRTDAEKKVKTTNQAFQEYKEVLAHLQQAKKEQEPEKNPPEEKIEKTKETGKPARKGQPEIEKISEQKKEQVLQAARKVYIEGRALQRSDNRTVNNAMLVQRAGELSQKQPGVFTEEQRKRIKETNERLNAMQVQKFHQDLNSGLDRFSTVMETDILRFDLASSMGRASILDKNEQINHVLKSVGAALENLPLPQMPDLPSIPNISPPLP